MPTTTTCGEDMRVEYGIMFRVPDPDFDVLNIDDENSDDNMDGLHMIVCLSRVKRIWKLNTMPYSAFSILMSMF